MTLCYYDKIKTCVIGKYWWCMDCYKYPKAQRANGQRKLHKRVVKECIMCALVKAKPLSYITKHHLVPNGLAQKHLSHKIGETVYMCLNHHTLFEALIEPLKEMLNAKSTYQNRKELTDYFIYMKLPELQKRITKIVNEVYKE